MRKYLQDILNLRETTDFDKTRAVISGGISLRGDEILKWEVQNKDTSVYITMYYSGPPVKDSLRAAIDSALKKHNLPSYHVKPMRMNLSREEISQLSVEATKQMFQEMHLQDMKTQSDSADAAKNRLPFGQYLKETRMVFPYIDTLSNGWLMIPGRNTDIDTIPVVFYKAKRRLGRAQQEQLYQFLKLRFAKDTVALLRW